MRKFLFVFTILISLTSNAQIPANYYNSADGLTGYALKSQLRSIITTGHDNQGYGSLYDGYQTTDTDNYYENDGTVLDMYSENPNGTDPYNYTHNSNNCGGSYSDENDCYNREHLMPQSWFNSAQPMKSDIHHVVPSDGYVNGQRGHYPLADVGSTSWTSLNGSKKGACSNAGYSGTVFEPINEFKGDIARIYFYMATRYQNEIGSWENANSNGSDPVLNGSSDQVFEDWYLDVLLQWHNQDPVSQREIDRNNAAYNYQGNANPFISHSEYVTIIWNPIPDNENPTSPTNLTATNITENSVDLSWAASTDNVGVIGYDVYQDNVLIGSTAVTNIQVTSLNDNTNYSFHTVAKDTATNTSTNSNTVTITTLIAPTYLIFEDFDDCDNQTSFWFYDEQSNENWECMTQYGENNSPAVQMNGYQSDVTSKDWLITTNAIDFSLFSNIKLSFFLIHKYGDMSLDLLYSTDYDGTGNAENFTWSAMPNVTIDTHDGSASEVTQTITDADISALNQSAYIAFKYYASSAPTRWTVDSFRIVGDNNTVAVSSTDFSNDILIYPNPTFNYVNINSNNHITNITIVNYLGKVVLSQNNMTSINLSLLNKGIYLCKITDEFGNVTIKKILKN